MRRCAAAWRRLAAAQVLAPALAGAAQDGAHDLRAADEHIIPAYRTLARATADFDRLARKLCEAPGEGRLEAARSGFHAAMDARQSIQHVRIGPVDLFQRGHRYQLWPDPRGPWTSISAGCRRAGTPRPCSRSASPRPASRYRASVPPNDCCSARADRARSCWAGRAAIPAPS